MTVNRERIELWAQALESDGYQRCSGNLRWTDFFGTTMHCAEGVAMAVAQAHGVQISLEQWDCSTMPPQVRAWYGLPGAAFLKTDDGMSHSIIWANDSVNMSFWDIAQGIRAMYLKDEQ